MMADAGGYVHFERLGLHPAIHLGFFDLRWYSLAYIAGILIGWWYLLRLLAQPGAPMARRHADDFVFYATIGILIGGRLAYCLFYKPEILRTPVEILKLWEGGMSFHGGLAGVLIALCYLAWKNKLSWLRICDYVCCCTPPGLMFGRLANFVNGELWGRPTSVPWAIVFPRTGDGIPRHPSQLYEAGLEGVLLFAVLSFLFWRTRARYQPGLLFGSGLIGYALCRIFIETLREPDAGLEHLSWGLTMGQTLSLPMMLAGLYLVVTARGRRARVEPIAGSESVA